MHALQHRQQCAQRIGTQRCLGRHRICMRASVKAYEAPSTRTAADELRALNQVTSLVPDQVRHMSHGTMRVLLAVTQGSNSRHGALAPRLLGVMLKHWLAMQVLLETSVPPKAATVSCLVLNGIMGSDMLGMRPYQVRLQSVK